MKLRLLCIGRLGEAWQREAAADYARRLSRYLPLEITELKEEKGGRKGETAALCQREGRRLLEKIPDDAYLVALDEGGRAFSSEKLAAALAKGMLHGGRDWYLVIGGPYGLDQAVRQRADLLLSLSKMTLTHQFARILLLEQLYRGCTIIKHEPYHNR